MIILTLNAGSSSIKYKLFEFSDADTEILSGQVDAIGQENCSIRQNGPGEYEVNGPEHFANHAEALNRLGQLIQTAGFSIDIIAHRVVHGGTAFSQPTLIDDSVMQTLKELIPLAPLHNPANIQGIEVAQQLFPQAKHVAIFDTAFHQTMPAKAFNYAIDKATAEKLHIRKYGFHGTSHDFVSQKAAEYLDKSREACSFISCHLGNGASICAIQNGQSIDTSMGMTPLAGLVMGTRSGDIDPGAVLYLQREGNLSADEVDTLLNKNSGLKGLCGDNDMRVVENRVADGDADAQLALDQFVYRIQQTIGAYMTQLPNLDAVIFTGGIGENGAMIRRMIIEPLQHLGLSIVDADKTEPVTNLSVDNKIKTLVINTDEEWQMASEARELTSKHIV